jgi:hypothetical protein
MSEQTQPNPARIAQTLRRVLETLPPLNTRQDDEARTFLAAEIKKLEGAGNDD